jgi:hypothetical protein
MALKVISREEAVRIFTDSQANIDTIQEEQQTWSDSK